VGLHQLGIIDFHVALQMADRDRDLQVIRPDELVAGFPDLCLA
jgi:hypothetical protein